MKKFFYISLFLMSGLSHAMDNNESGGSSGNPNAKSLWKKVLTILIPKRQSARASLENTQSPSSPISPGSASTKTRSAMKGSRNSSGGSPSGIEMSRKSSGGSSSGIEMSPRVYFDEGKNQLHTFKLDPAEKAGSVLNPRGASRRRRVVLQETPPVVGLSTMVPSDTVGQSSDGTQPSYYVDGDINPCEDGLTPYRKIKEEHPLDTIIEEQPLNTALSDDDESFD